MSPPPLPIDSHIKDVAAALDRHRAAVLTAAPGAGKTTRVPPALIDRGRVVLLQPRRVAARAIARRIAEENNWTVGREVGWHMRLDRQFTDETKVLVVTEGILTRYLQSDPLLSGVATLILDEFHERSIHADLGIALAKQAWMARDDLRILVMSATLATGPLSAFLHDCPVIEVPGTSHPLTIDYGPGDSNAEALFQVLRRTEGNVLFFLPGSGEISRALSEVKGVLHGYGYSGLSLHGSMSAQDQEFALKPTQSRRVILTTNIAETSLTVPGISAVVDSGLHKVARFDADRGVDSLRIERITLDSADQRAGRAARLGPGIVRRLWDPRDRLRPHREPEIDRVDLASPVLSILAAGAPLADFEWFDRPAADRVDAAIELLTRLGAVAGGRITPTGKLMDGFGLPPRLARILVEGRGALEIVQACAWLAQPTQLPAAAATPSDILTAIDRWRELPFEVHHFTSELARISARVFGRAGPRHASEEDLRRALLAGYPDRVAKRRSANKVTLASGHGAVIGRESGVHDAEWLIALDVTAGRAGPNTEAVIRIASRIEREWLAPTSSTVEQKIDEGGALKTREIDWYGELILAERQRAADGDMMAAALAAAWMEREPDERSSRLLQRIKFAGLNLDLPNVIVAAAAGARRVQDIVLTEELLSWDARRQLAIHAPDTLKVPSGREHPIEYDADGYVSVSVKLQELFGLADTPLVGPNRVPVTFHLLAPSGRPVQTTRDLKSFWERTYPEVRKELRGRYPRHPWPEDPWNATPTHKTKPR
ncbi:MAG TPA: ATP-dependent helicase C-terminal domain-containing protein [Vicinamibacterales bacterium]|nr:ATP-dependent helicase C-terminal domain-containing protein [Vicinamibacterales bacterium]